ncbi:hypothetical protein DB88DRAFT_495539 [Papiliotrema laurentii]|uniref:SWIM-type domain-containing protein n=1 Tax=Papiliotrema laurentii TaxID=5418 RepID=A0AAD9CY47_PAPLA|nr:hypothetical protein DB88DRAFT_495539 [Papiliotrema laurentii]
MDGRGSREMIHTASNDFLNLVATLIAQLPSSPSQPLNDQILLQLNMIFGPMLMSALQLIDRREVVRVSLPSGRSVWQVTSSTGLPYSIHLPLPTRKPLAASSAPNEHVQQDTSLSDRQEAEPKELPPLIERHGALELLPSFSGMYCPCTGFAYNTLSSDRNYFCKHLLAIVLAHQMGQQVEAEVGLPGVAGLLGLE